MLGHVAEAAAQGQERRLVIEAQTRLEAIAAAEKGFARQQGYLDRLKADPKDADANLELGKYYGLIKRHWDRALPYLARGSAPALKTLAEQRDLANRATRCRSLRFADAW